MHTCILNQNYVYVTGGNKKGRKERNKSDKDRGKERTHFKILTLQAPLVTRQAFNHIQVRDARVSCCLGILYIVLDLALLNSFLLPFL